MYIIHINIINILFYNKLVLYHVIINKEKKLHILHFLLFCFILLFFGFKIFIIKKRKFHMFY